MNPNIDRGCEDAVAALRAAGARTTHSCSALPADHIGREAGFAYTTWSESGYVRWVEETPEEVAATDRILDALRDLVAVWRRDGAVAVYLHPTRRDPEATRDAWRALVEALAPLA